MSRSILKVAVSVAVVVSVLLATALPAAALTFQGMGFYARFGPSMATDVRGLVVGDHLGGDNPRLTAGLVGLLPHIEFTIVGTSIGCGGSPGPGNRIFKVEAMADAHGDAFFTRIMAEWSRLDLRSIWINWGDGAVCSFSLNFEEIKVNLTPTYNGDARLALTKQGTGTLILLLERRPNERARLSIVVGGLQGDGELSIRLVNKGCGMSPTKTLVSYRETDFPFSSYITTTGPLTQKGLDSIRSLRVKGLDSNNTWCGPVSLIIVVV